MEKYYVREKTDMESEGLKNYPELVAELLAQRGIKDLKEADKFLNPDYEKHLHSPFFMRDMDLAAERILKAVAQGERIVLYTDFDADGISSGVIFSDFLNKIGYKNFGIYIPHRDKEGYGLNKEALENIAKEGASLLITADCGITETENAQVALSLGLDFIITDHHIPNGKTPSALAILNPKVDDYPDKDLCGAGVIFKLIQALIEKGDYNNLKEWSKWLLDMVGLATIADMVPLRGENRVFGYYGLLVLSKTKRPGLLELYKIMRINSSSITEDDVGFMIAPRINAVSRMESADTAFELLSGLDFAAARRNAEYVNKLNDKRKGVVASMIKEIKNKIEDSSLGEQDRVLVVGNPNWKPSLLGLAANTLVKEYSCPVFLWGREGNGALKGSCRSDGSIDLSVFMEKLGDTLLQYGGHKWAGGFSISFEQVHGLREKIIETYKKISTPVSEKTPIDKVLTPDSVNWPNYKSIARLAPFGVENPKPLFLIKDVLIDKAEEFGRQGDHFKISFKNNSEGEIQGISFFTNREDFEKKPVVGARVDLVASIESSDFGGRRHIRLRVVDVV